MSEDAHETPEQEPSPPQIDMGALMGQIHGPLLRSVLESMMHYQGSLAIGTLAGTLGSVFQPWRTQLRDFNPEGMPPAVLEFHSGLAAIVEHVFQVAEDRKNRVILPHEQ